MSGNEQWLVFKHLFASFTQYRNKLFVDKMATDVKKGFIMKIWNEKKMMTRAMTTFNISTSNECTTEQKKNSFLRLVKFKKKTFLLRTLGILTHFKNLKLLFAHSKTSLVNIGEEVCSFRVFLRTRISFLRGCEIIFCLPSRVKRLYIFPSFGSPTCARIKRS